MLVKLALDGTQAISTQSRCSLPRDIRYDSESSSVDG